MIGRVSRGFDLLSYRVSVARLRLARQTIEMWVARVAQRDEQGVATSHIGGYVQCWEGWVRAGPERGGCENWADPIRVLTAGGVSIPCLVLTS